MPVHRYSIDRNTDLERFFNIEAATGVISTAKALDREVNAVHNITIFAIESRKCTPYCGAGLRDIGKKYHSIATFDSFTNFLDSVNAFIDQNHQMYKQ